MDRIAEPQPPASSVGALGILAQWLPRREAGPVSSARRALKPVPRAQATQVPLPLARLPPPPAALPGQDPRPDPRPRSLRPASPAPFHVADFTTYMTQVPTTWSEWGLLLRGLPHTSMTLPTAQGKLLRGSKPETPQAGAQSGAPTLARGGGVHTRDISWSHLGASSVKRCPSPILHLRKRLRDTE